MVSSSFCQINIIMSIGVQRICDTLGEANWVYDVSIPERISKETLDMFKEKLGANKPKKGKKGGKKKKKK